MDLRSRIGLGLRTAAARAAGALGAFASSPIVPGVGRNIGAPYKLPQDVPAQKVVDSRAALYGRVTANLGPVQSNISTHPLRRLTPARIGAIQEEVLVIGWMLNWACLVEDVILTDSEIWSAQQTATSAITGSPFSVEPADGSPEARAIADYQQVVIDSISGWDRAMDRLLVGNAGGYAIEDVTYEERTVQFPLGKSQVSVEAFTPVALDYVHNKHSRWNIGADDQLELDTGKGFIVPRPHKFVVYEASGPYQVRRRGYAYPAIWLVLLRANAWARWGAVLEQWGLPVPYGVADKDLWQDETRKQVMLQTLIEHGQGHPGLFSDDFEIKSSPAASAPLDSRGMHASIIAAINLELAKLILGASLQTEISGTGSYGASETHAGTQQARMLSWEKNLSCCVRDWMRAALRLACYKFGTDEPLPRGLPSALGIPPERVIALCGRPTWRVQREVTPQVRMSLFDAGINRLGLEICADQAMREFGFAKARHADHRLRGAPVPVAADAAAVSTTDALDGVDNPKPEAGPVDKPAAKRKRPSRSKRN